jgi:hypothetical protein
VIGINVSQDKSLVDFALAVAGQEHSGEVQSSVGLMTTDSTCVTVG